MKMNPAIDPRFAAYELRVHRSRIHGRGVYAAEAIPAGRKVIEYTGERLSRDEAIRRLTKICRNRRTRRVTMFKLDRYWRIDGAVGGSGAEFVNHCCDPNLRTRIIRGHILMFSGRRIRPREELTIDYGLHPKTHRIPCRCGSPKCRGTVNRKLRED
jgi:SET domain-containing protein